jgi:hypothetical protein
MIKELFGIPFDKEESKELLHLVMRFMFPNQNKKSFDKTEFKRSLHISAEDL